MNKIKSARVHLLKFLFVLPLLALLLLAFRDSAPSKNSYYANGIVVDAVSLEPITGVTVKEEFSGLTAITDKNGYYAVALPISDKRLQRRFYFSNPGYHAIMDDRAMIYKTIPEKDGSLLFVGLSRNGKGYFAKEIDLPQKDGSLVTHPDGATLQQLYQTAKANLNAEQDSQSMSAIPPSPELQQILDQSQEPYHYLNGTHYLIGEKGPVANVSGSFKRLMIEVAGVQYTGEALNKKFSKQQMGGCRVRVLDEAAATEQDTDVIIMATIKE